MPLLALGLVLVSAFLHAAWNAIVKAGDDRLVAGWATVAGAALSTLPLVAFSGLPSSRALVFVVGSGILHGVYNIALTRAYDHGDLSLVYPIARGVAPTLATVGAILVFHEALPGPAYLGIAIVAGGVLLLGVLGRRTALPPAAVPPRLRVPARVCPGLGLRRGQYAREPRRPGDAGMGTQGVAGQAIAWSLFTGACIATYTLIDRQGIRETSTLSYTAGLFWMNVLVVSLYVRVRRRHWPWRLVAPGRWGTLALSGALSMGAYLLVLLALSISRVGYIAALRETSVLIAAWVGWRRLGDLQGIPRLLSSAVVALGLALLVVFR